MNGAIDIITKVVYESKVVDEIRCQRCDRLLGKHFEGNVEIVCPRCGKKHELKTT